MSYHRYQSRKVCNSRNERGTAIVELAIFLPLLMLLLSAIIDLFFISLTYLHLAQISREAVLTGTHFPAIAGSSATLNPSETAYGACLTSGTASCAHTVIHWRVRKLIESNAVRFKANTLSINSSYDTVKNTVTVRITCGYQGFFGLFGGITVGAKSTGGYIG